MGGGNAACCILCCMSSLRTQIYLTRDQRRKLDARARREDKTLASVIRDAVEAYTAEEPPDIDQALTSTYGAVPDLEVPPRSEWDRGVD
jgi:hypothetical protein